MDWKQRLQQDLQEAMRAKDEPRLNVIRIMIAALEQAQEEKGKQAFDSSNPQEADIPPDREQTLSKQAIEDVFRTEAERRREYIEQLRGEGRTEQVEQEERELAILDDYMKTM